MTGHEWQNLAATIADDYTETEQLRKKLRTNLPEKLHEAFDMLVTTYKLNHRKSDFEGQITEALPKELKKGLSDLEALFDKQSE